MPNSKSAKKRLRQSEERRVRNRAVKSTLRTLTRKFREAVTANQLDDAKSMLPRLSKAWDQAAAKGVVHENKASRMKSRASAAIIRGSTAATAS